MQSVMQSVPVAAVSGLSKILLAPTWASLNCRNMETQGFQTIELSGEGRVAHGSHLHFEIQIYQ
jgi:hypothetical protein